MFDRKPFFTVLATFGFALVTLAAALVALVAMLDNALEGAVPFIAMMGGVGVIGLALSWFVGRWAFILPVLGAAALLAMFAPFLPIILSLPQAGLEFVAVAWFVLGALLGIVGGIVSLVQWLRKTARPGVSGAQRAVLMGGAALALALAVLGIGAQTAAATKLAENERAGAASVSIKQYAFQPGVVQAQAGQTVRLAVVNEDASLHTFSIPELGVEEIMTPGAERLVEFAVPAAGTYTIVCLPHSYETEDGWVGMTAQLVVQ